MPKQLILAVRKLEKTSRGLFYEAGVIISRVFMAGLIRKVDPDGMAVVMSTSKPANIAILPCAAP